MIGIELHGSPPRLRFRMRWSDELSTFVGASQGFRAPNLSDLTRFDEMNRAYGTFFQEGREPARTCVEVRRLIGDCGVEITCVARR